ncbi:MAG: acyl carrier protein [Gemmatimonadaceae bacterium]
MTGIDDIRELLLDAARELNHELEFKVAVELGGSATLFGRDGVLDSLSLVSFIVAVEQEIADRFGTPVTLADEKALSQSRSPFRTIDALAAHVSARLSELGP